MVAHIWPTCGCPVVLESGSASRQSFSFPFAVETELRSEAAEQRAETAAELMQRFSSAAALLLDTIRTATSIAARREGGDWLDRSTLPRVVATAVVALRSSLPYVAAAAASARRLADALAVVKYGDVVCSSMGPRQLEEGVSGDCASSSAPAECPPLSAAQRGRLWGCVVGLSLRLRRSPPSPPLGRQPRSLCCRLCPPPTLAPTISRLHRPRVPLSPPLPMRWLPSPPRSSPSTQPLQPPLHRLDPAAMDSPPPPTAMRAATQR